MYKVEKNFASKESSKKINSLEIERVNFKKTLLNINFFFNLHSFKIFY